MPRMRPLKTRFGFSAKLPYDSVYEYLFQQFRAPVLNKRNIHHKKSKTADLFLKISKGRYL